MNAQTNVNNSGQKIRTVDITVTAAMAALVFLGTYIFKIPTRYVQERYRTKP